MTALLMPMRWFWRSSTLALALALAFKRAFGSKVTCRMEANANANAKVSKKWTLLAEKERF